MKIGILTSSRADYSIYFPLLKEIRDNTDHDLKIIAFGTHLSVAHGRTIDNIIADGFEVAYQVNTMPDGDSPLAVSRAMGETVTNFSQFWQDTKFDIVFCLGDRYEMFAACSASVPYNVKLAHIHGGEETLGAYDNIFRHSITHMSQVHFTTTEKYCQRVIELTHTHKNVFNVGALSIDNLTSLTLLSVEEFRKKFDIDLSIPSILITFHPETVSFEKNEEYTDELIAALTAVAMDYQLIITMPNADTMGNMIRYKLKNFIAASGAKGVESFGTIGYLSCMKYASLMLGNTSSGFVEAAFFSKHVINLGKRQLGRILTPNIHNCPLERDSIIRAIKDFENTLPAAQTNIYGSGGTAKKIVLVLNQLHD